MKRAPAACPYCGADLDARGNCERCGGVLRPTPATGWRPDPTARFEGRFYTAGHPTNRVRNGRSESDDPVGAHMLPAHVDVPVARSSIRLTWLATGVTTAVIVMVAGVVGGLLWARHRATPPPDVDYVQALQTAGLFDQFNSEANAVAHGHEVCNQLEHGGQQQGLLADKIAVDVFCPRFNKGFRVLESAKISGVFVLTDTLGTGSILTEGGACHGTGGYADVGRTTPMTVKNDKGEVLSTTSLGGGTGDSANCTFSFTFPINEGQDHYVVSIGRRGEFSYSFEQLRSHGVQIHLGR